MKAFKIFMAAFLGMLLAIISALFVYAEYCDYRARAQTNNWLVVLAYTKEDIEKRLLAGEPVNNIAKPKLSPDPQVFLIRPDGMIIMHGGLEGQLLVLIPEVKNAKVQWDCYVGSDKAAPSVCKVK